MKLGKLLGAGRSIFGGKPAVSYRLNHQTLPKFNEGNNPFATKSAAEPSLPRVASPQAEHAPVPVASLAPTVPVATVAPRFTAAAKVAAKATAPAPAPADKSRQGWATRLNPFRPATPAPQPRVVQCELSLNDVKVVHNDLSDADVDVVPVKSNVNAPVEAAVLPPARKAWEYLGERVINS